MGDYKLSEQEFNKIRNEVLQTWPTGAEVDFDEAVEYQKAIPENKNFAKVLWKAHKNGVTLLQPRAGVALIKDHIELLQYLESEGEADLLPTTIDAYTRLNKYENAADGVEKSLAAKTSLLNGFPAVNHGVKGCRIVTESLKVPVQIRHGTPDARLLAEISLAGGFTSFEGGGISYNVPYAKKVPIQKSIDDWKYVDRLVGAYEERGISINREPFGPLTGTLVPPCISHVVGIIEGILALRQGVKSLTLGYGQGGNLLQDVVALKALKEVANYYFKKEGFEDYELTTVFHQWMGGFPADEAKAFAVISWGTAAGVMAGADKIIVKTPHEARGIPTKEANAQGIKCSKQVANLLQGQNILLGGRYQEEFDLLKREISDLMDKIYELGDGDIEKGTVAAFEAGTLDVPFAPSIYNNGKILPMRDNEGLIRIYNKGSLALSDEVMEYHKARLEERANYERRKVSFQMVTDDIYAISKGRLIGRTK